MSAAVTHIHEHRCAYILRVGDHWISTSPCHYGDVLPLAPPAPKRRAS